MVANRIKGITVEIGGDTTKLQTALKGVNTEIRNTQSQLRDVEKLLKLDPGNTELLAQRHRLLGQAVSETKEKLETLKTAAEQANTALANGEISQEQYDALQREIIETENALRNLEQQANQSATAVQRIAASGEKLQTLGDNISSVGKKFLPVTGAVAGLGTMAVKTAADFDSAMSQVAAVSGATGVDLEALQDKAREMGSKTKFSASEAAEAMNYMAMAGWKTSDMLSGIEGIMNLATASGEDLATTSDIVTDALTAFGLSAADSGHFADILAAASSNANTNVSMMGEMFKYCAPIAGALGFSAEDTAEAIGLMANAGIKSSQAGTSLRTIMNNLAGDVKICGSNIGEVTVTTTNADGSMRDLSDILADCRAAFAGLSDSEKAAAAETLVGKNAMSGFLALMNAAKRRDDLPAAPIRFPGRSYAGIAAGSMGARSGIPIRRTGFWSGNATRSTGGRAAGRRTFPRGISGGLSLRLSIRCWGTGRRSWRHAEGAEDSCGNSSKTDGCQFRKSSQGRGKTWNLYRKQGGPCSRQGNLGSNQDGSISCEISAGADGQRDRNYCAFCDYDWSDWRGSLS